jgi:Tol biopolymer transport system component
VFSPDGAAVCFTYEDAVLEAAAAAGTNAEQSLRCVGVSVCGRPILVPKTHPRNHDGSAFTVLASRLTDAPRPGSDEISRAFEEAWIGTNGYVRADGSRQRRAIAFQSDVVTATGVTISEVFVLDLPDDLAALSIAGDGPIAGTAVTRPAPPRGVTQRRLTFTADRQHPGIQGPRHWLRSSPDGSRIAFLMRDDAGIVQIFTVDPAGGQPRQVTYGATSIASAFSWSPDGRHLACVIDGSVCLVAADSGAVTRLTPTVRNGSAPRPEACVISPDGRRIAYVRHIAGSDGRAWNQIFTVETQ